MMNIQDHPNLLHSAGNENDVMEEEEEEKKIANGTCFSWTVFLSYAGPGCLIAIAYLDPGNLEADLQVSLC